LFTFISYFKYLTYRIVYLKIWVRFCTTLNTGTDFASDNRSANSFILNHRSRPFTEIFSLKFVCLLGLTLCSSIVLISHILLDSNKRKIQIYIYRPAGFRAPYILYPASYHPPSQVQPLMPQFSNK